MACIMVLFASFKQEVQWYQGKHRAQVSCPIIPKGFVTTKVMVCTIFYIRPVI